MKKLSLLTGILLTFCLTGSNLILDPECDKFPSPEVGLSEGAKTGKLSQLIEDRTWNRCLKMELLKFSDNTPGNRKVSLAMRLGGRGKVWGFPVKPDTVYNFSFEAKGNAYRVLTGVYLWSSENDNSSRTRSKKASSIKLFKPQKDWTVYRGTFKTSSDTRRAALYLQFWGKESSRDLYEKPGDFILVDKIKVEEAQQNILSKKAEPAAAEKSSLLPVVVVKQKAPEKPQIAHFMDYAVPAPARGAKTTAKIFRSGKSLLFEIRCLIPPGARPFAKCRTQGSDEIWNDDLVELFIADAVTGAFRQFVVSAGNCRWAGNGTPVPPKDNYSWKSSVDMKDRYFDVRFEIPFSLLGFSNTPRPGTVLRFNIGRQRQIPGQFPKPDFSKANRWRNRKMIDISSAARPYGVAGENLKTSGVLVIDDLQPVISRIRQETKKYNDAPEAAALWKQINKQDPALCWNLLDAIRKTCRKLELSQQSFLLNQISVSTDPAVPFFPRELGSEQKVFRIRAAVNEYAPMALALANTGKEFEEYRVFLTSGWSRKDPAHEQNARVLDLQGKNGSVFPRSKITLRRGLPYKDSETPHRGRRLDILARLNEAGTIPVLPQQAGLLWLTFDCSGIKPGVYRGEINVIPLNGINRKISHSPSGFRYDGEARSFPIEIEVLPITLPEKSPLPLSPVVRIVRDDQGDFMKQYDCFMYMVTPWFFTFKYNPDGSIKEYSVRSYLYPQIKKTLAALKKNPHISDPKIRFGHSMYQVWKEHLGGKVLKFNTPEYWNGWRNYCKGVVKILQEQGFRKEEFVLELFDEPSTKEFTVHELLTAHRECKKVLPDVLIQMASGISFIEQDKVFEELTKVIDLWTFSFYRTNIPSYRKKMKYFHAQKGKHMQIYACGTSMRQDLYRYYRLLPWNAMEAGADSVSLYCLFPMSPLGNDLYRVPAGDAAYMTSDGIMPSVRLENLRTGFTDIKYLKLLESMAKGSSPLEKKIRKFIQDSLKDVYIVQPHNTARADEVRQQAVKYILQLQKRK